MAVLCAFTLCACSGGSNDAPTADDAPKAIVIGQSGPLTGGAAVYGLAVQHGAELAVEEINAKGGLQFQFVCLDDEHDAEKAVTAFNDLVDKGLQVGLLTTTTAPARAVADLYEEADIFAITPSASADDVPQGRGNVFQMCFTDSNQGIGAADYMAADATISTVLTIYSDDTTANNDEGKAMWATSDDSNIAKFVNYLLDCWNVEKNIYQWANSLIKYGDLYLRLYRESDIKNNLLYNRLIFDIISE